MTKLIARRKELNALRASTNDFVDIRICHSLKDYWKVNVSSWKNAGNALGQHTKKQWQGLVIGEPFLNYWLDQQKMRGVAFDRIATQDEDTGGVDAWAIDLNNPGEMETLAVNHKFYAGGMITKSDTAGLGWAPQRPMLITTAYEVSFPLQDAIRDRKGVLVTGSDIYHSVENNNFWKSYADYLIDNYAEWKIREAKAKADAKAAANRQLDQWQIDDLKVLTA